MQSTPQTPPELRRSRREVTPDPTLLEFPRASRKMPSRTVSRPATPVPESPQTAKRLKPPSSSLRLHRALYRPAFPSSPVRSRKRKMGEIVSPFKPFESCCKPKLNHPRPTEAAIDANAPLPDDIDPSGPVDSDEEKDAVMAGIARSRPQPLAQHIHVPLKKRCYYARVTEQLHAALNGPRGVYGTPNGMGPYANFGNVGVNAGANTEGVEGERKLSVAQQLGMAVANGVRAANGVGGGAAAANGAGGAPGRKASTSSLIPLDLDVPNFG